MMVKNENIFENDFVIFQRGNYLKACRVSTKRPQKFGKRGEGQITIDFEGGIGHPFGSTFRLVRGDKKIFTLELYEDDNEGLELGKESGMDNRNIFDDGQSQTLSKSDIKQLVDSGISGDEVILTITNNSKTFKSKTKYSQEKYVNKKMKKYDEMITLHRPSIRHILHMYYLQDPLKISNLRIDSLSQMLAYVNVKPGGKYAVYEAGMQGVVSAAVLSQIGKYGSLVHVYSGYNINREAIDLMAFDTSEKLSLSFLGTDNLPKYSAGEEDLSEINGINKLEDKINVDETNEDVIKSDTSESSKTDISETVKVSENTGNVRISKFVRSCAEDIELSTAILKEGVNGLIVACRQHPSSITLALLSYLLPGHSFAIFSPYKETLIELFVELKVRNCINVRLVENWLRNYQVLPERTHPEVSMSGGGGYILTGWKVEE